MMPKRFTCDVAGCGQVTPIVKPSFVTARKTLWGPQQSPFPQQQQSQEADAEADADADTRGAAGERLAWMRAL